jgi:transposase InsO family protein
MVKAVPVFFGSWKNKGAGHGQVDTVVHCGEKLMGNMVYTVNYSDVATCWVEPVAQLNKTERATTQSLETVRQRLPWAPKELHPDSGSEFLNDLAITWAKANGIALSRSRPSKKNDNAFVEQKNRSVVREYVGYERYDCQEAVVVMNELYAVLRLYINFFQPVYKLQGKEKRVYKADCQPPQILNTQFLLNHVFRAATRGSQRKLLGSCVSLYEYACGCSST